MKIERRLVGVIFEDKVIGETDEIEDFIAREESGKAETVCVATRKDENFHCQKTEISIRERVELLDGPDQGKQALVMETIWRETTSERSQNDEERGKFEQKRIG